MEYLIPKFNWQREDEDNGRGARTKGLGGGGVNSKVTASFDGVSYVIPHGNWCRVSAHPESRISADEYEEGSKNMAL